MVVWAVWISRDRGYRIEDKVRNKIGVWVHRPQDKYSVAALVCAAGRAEQCGKCLDRTSWRGGEWRSIGVNVGSIGDVFGGIGLGRVRVERGVGFWVSGDWFFGLGMVVWFENGCLV